MIRLRVDWHCQCPGCGTQLAVDFFENSADCAICPWCGFLYDVNCGTDQDEVREYVSRAVKEIEEKANSKVLV